ncbi:helix-turn-helix domain-containing protein [Paenibacillus sp. MBLB4367]|uniref:helix-turn-helix domain-containing protein n=1 Tax=Paenibacillus sp. MBLB4367 TaxID=3384767 RepID=UPI003907FAB4
MRMRLSRLTFKQKLIIFSVIISTLPVLILGLSSSYIVQKSIQEEVDTNHQTVLKQIEFQLNNFVKNLQISALSIASDKTIEKAMQLPPPSDNLSQTLEMTDVLIKHQSFSSIRFTASLIYKKYDFAFSNKSPRFFYEIMEKVQPQFNATFMVTPNTYVNQDELLLFSPVPRHTYYTDGILVLHVTIRELTTFLEKLTFGHRSKVFIVDETGRIIVSQNKDEIGTKLADTNDLYHFWKDPEGFQGSFVLKGENYKLTAQTSSLNNWTYIAMTPISEFTEKSDNIRHLTWLLFAGIALVWTAIAFIGSSRLYFPIERMLRRFTDEHKLDRTGKEGLEAIDSMMKQMALNNIDLQKKLNEHMPYLRESLFHHLLRGEMSEKEFMQKTEQLDLPFTGSHFAVCVSTVDDYNLFIQTYPQKDRSLIHFALRKILEETCENELPCLTFSFQPGQVTALFGLKADTEGVEQKLVMLMDRFRENVREYFRFTVSVAISRPRIGFGGTQACFQEAVGLLGHRLLLGSNVTIMDRQIAPSMKQSGRALVQGMKDMAHSLLNGKTSDAIDQLDSLIATVAKGAYSSEMATGLFSYLLGELDYFMNELDCSLDDFFQEDLYKRLTSLNTLQEVRDWLAGTVFPEIVSKLETYNVSKQKRLIQQVLIDIHEHFETDLSLQQTAEQFQLHPSQLSRMFKEVTGMNFIDYLIQFRMRKAAEWLAHSQLPIKDIADRLRYSSVQNFSRVFKQIIGVPPGEYRKQHQASAET